MGIILHEKGSADVLMKITLDAKHPRFDDAYHTFQKFRQTRHIRPPFESGADMSLVNINSI